jgi:hypothetical protein
MDTSNVEQSLVAGVAARIHHSANLTVYHGSTLPLHSKNHDNLNIEIACKLNIGDVLPKAPQIMAHRMSEVLATWSPLDTNRLF